LIQSKDQNSLVWLGARKNAMQSLNASASPEKDRMMQGIQARMGATIEI
jgi:hypothetical protein